VLRRGRGTARLALTLAASWTRTLPPACGSLAGGYRDAALRGRWQYGRPVQVACQVTGDGHRGRVHCGTPVAFVSLRSPKLTIAPGGAAGGRNLRGPCRMRPARGLARALWVEGWRAHWIWRTGMVAAHAKPAPDPQLANSPRCGARSAGTRARFRCLLSAGMLRTLG